jgi:hypothetical protein
LFLPFLRMWSALWVSSCSRRSRSLSRLSSSTVREACAFGGSSNGFASSECVDANGFWVSSPEMKWLPSGQEIRGSVIRRTHNGSSRGGLQNEVGVTARCAYASCSTQVRSERHVPVVHSPGSARSAIVRPRASATARLAHRPSPSPRGRAASKALCNNQRDEQTITHGAQWSTLHRPLVLLTGERKP